MSDYRFDTDLLSLLPPWYRDVLDYQQICGSESEEFEALADSISAVADNFFFQTMDAGSIQQWERIFKITADPETETLDFRRARLLNRISTQPPFTLGFLYKKLDELIGEGEWAVSVDYPNYTLYVESSAEDQSYAQEVAVTIGSIKPAHIVYVNLPYLRSGILLNEEINLYFNTWNYRLGAWGLGELPFESVEDKGVIKVPSTPSIQSAMLNDTATFVSSDIAKARVNGTTVITSLTKTVSDNTVTVVYDVSTSIGSAITQLELLDSDSNVLTSATVYIPLSSETSIKHVIVTQEGVSNNGN